MPEEKMYCPECKAEVFTAQVANGPEDYDTIAWCPNCKLTMDPSEVVWESEVCP